MAGKPLRIWATTFSAAALMIAAPLFAPQTQAQPAAMAIPDNMQRMVYHIYAGGIHAVRAELDIVYEEADQDYKLELRAHTRGFLGRLAPWKGSFLTEGWRKVKEDAEQPQLHKSVSTWRDETEIKRFNYGQDGSFISLEIEEEGQDKSPKGLEYELTQGTIDAMTAALQVMKKVSDEGECQSSADVFDGKRRFTMSFNHDKTEELSPSRYNVYKGEAARCVVEVKPVSGAWHKKPRGWLSIQEQGRQKGSLPTVWMAKISEDGPAVPVKLRLKTEYGTLFMHMTEYHHGDQVIALED